MMRKYSKALVWSLTMLIGSILGTFSLHASESTITTTDDITEVRTALAPGALLLLDLDDTTFTAETLLGSARWFYSGVSRAVESGKDRDKSIRSLYPLWRESQQAVEVRLVDDRILDLIQEAKAAGAYVIGMTARQVSVSQTTLDLLASVGVDFSDNPFSNIDFHFSFAEPARFYDGVLFCADYNAKGDVLTEFLRQATRHHVEINSIILADDSRRNIDSCEDVCKHLDLDYSGFYYTKVQGEVTPEDLCVACHQLRWLRSGIPNDVAMAILALPEGPSYLAEYQNIVSASTRGDYTLSADLPPCSEPITGTAGGHGENRFIESMSIADVLALADERTLFVFDLHDTLMQNTASIGSTTWAAEVLRDGISRGYSKEETYDRMMPFWHDVLLNSSVKPVEPDTAYVIRKLQERGCPTIGLTARYVEMAYATIHQLKTIEIDFTRSPVGENDFAIAAPYPSKFLGGVVFCGLQNRKGPVFLQFLQQHPVDFEKIVFVDDQQKNVESMAEAAAILDKPYTGIWYRAVASHGQVNPSIAHIQQVFFNRIVPDNLARKVIDKLK